MPLSYSKRKIKRKREVNELQLGNQIFVKDFQLDPDAFPVPSDLESWRERIRAVISELIDNDMERLLLILYRIDVREEEVKRILTEEKPGLIAASIADLIVERELQKVRTRLKYRSQ